MVTLVSGFDDNLGQDRELCGANGRGHMGMFRFGGCQLPRRGGGGSPKERRMGWNPQVPTRIRWGKV